MRKGCDATRFGDTGSRRPADSFVRSLLAREIITTKWSMDPLRECEWPVTRPLGLTSRIGTAAVTPTTTTTMVASVDHPGASSLLVVITPMVRMVPPFVGQCTIDFGYLCQDVTVRLILRGLLLQWKKSNQPSEQSKLNVIKVRAVNVKELEKGGYEARSYEAKSWHVSFVTTALLNVQRCQDFSSRRWKSQARRRCKPHNDKSLCRADNSIFANWRHKEVQLPTKRALFFVLHLFLLPAEIRLGTPEIPPPMVCMQTPTARGRRTCSRKKSPGFADGWQSDLFHVRMVTPMQIALTRLKARYWHWMSSVSWPAGQSRCQIYGRDTPESENAISHCHMLFTETPASMYLYGLSNYSQEKILRVIINHDHNTARSLKGPKVDAEVRQDAERIRIVVEAT
ncbi:hypothetical protein G5I_08429 [Acromyrmex echinatior]|uniref:Uncharacterized protein n=1 Tax=Acromyrmex echinatior TaxID=103372 RepID=F4WRH5_ACREC|nr:hypothetical protein G5I_08429 [Acromyrmex echinatior]